MSRPMKLATVLLAALALALPVAAQPENSPRGGTSRASETCNPDLPEPPPRGCGGIALVTENGFTVPYPPSGGSIPQPTIQHFYHCNSVEWAPVLTPLRLGSNICLCRRTQFTCLADYCAQQASGAPSLADCPNTCVQDSVSIRRQTAENGRVTVELGISNYEPFFGTAGIVRFEIANAAGIIDSFTDTSLSAEEPCAVPGLCVYTPPALVPGTYDIRVSIYATSCFEGSINYQAGETENFRMVIDENRVAHDPVPYP